MTTTRVEGRRYPQFTLGDRLRKARELTGMDRQHFAAEIGIHRESVMRYETDQQIPRPPVLRVWALATGVDAEWLRNGETPKPEGPGGDGEGLPDLDSNQEPAGSLRRGIIHWEPEQTLDMEEAA